jgi:hypothetical protein
MKYLLLSFLCLFSLLHSQEMDQPELIETISQKIAASKPANDDQTTTVASYEADRKRLEREIAETLPQLDASKGLPSAIAALVKSDESNLKMIAGGGAEGLSGNSLFILNAAGKPAAIIKVFKEGKGEFVDELLALTTFKNLDLKHFFVPGVLAIGRSVSPAHQHLMIVEEFAPGKPLYTPLIEIFELPIDSPQRKEIFATFLIGMNELGKSLAELHTAGNPETKPMIPGLQEAYLLDAEKGTKSFVEKDPAHADLGKKALALFKKGLEERGAKPLGYMHCDAHLGNYIWNEEQKKLAIIDVTESGVSVGKAFQPIGTPMLDFARILTEITYWSHWGLTEEETAQMQNSFLSGYRSINPAFSSDSKEVPLFQMINAYRYFEWSVRMQDQLSEEVHKHIAPLWPQYIEVMKRL